MQLPVGVGAKARLVDPVRYWRRTSGSICGAWDGFDDGGEGTLSGGRLLRQQVNRAGSRTDERVRWPDAEA
jgi:hypothetical protein